MFFDFDLEYVLVLSVSQSRLLKVREHEEVWHHQEGQQKSIVHRREPIMQNGESGQRLEAVSKTSASTESRYKLLRNGLDVADDRGLADST